MVTPVGSVLQLTAVQPCPSRQSAADVITFAAFAIGVDCSIITASKQASPYSPRTTLSPFETRHHASPAGSHDVVKVSTSRSDECGSVGRECGGHGGLSITVARVAVDMKMEGHSMQRIAVLLYLSVHTVETHPENIKRKLNVENASQLNRLAMLWISENR